MAGLKPWIEAPCQAFPLPRTFGKGAWGSLLHSNAPPYIWDLPARTLRKIPSPFLGLLGHTHWQGGMGELTSNFIVTPPPIFGTFLWRRGVVSLSSPSGEDD
jgi:hypothetical protein